MTGMESPSSSIQGWTLRRIVHGWLYIEELAHGMSIEDLVVLVSPNRNDDNDDDDNALNRDYWRHNEEEQVEGQENAADKNNNDKEENHLRNDASIPTYTLRDANGETTLPPSPPESPLSHEFADESSAFGDENQSHRPPRHRRYHHILLSTTQAETTSTTTTTTTVVSTNRWRRRLRNVIVLLLFALLVSYYAFVHVHLIQKEDRVFYTEWYYEWFMIPVLLSFAFCRPLHWALGDGHNGGVRAESGRTASAEGMIPSSSGRIDESDRNDDYMNEENEQAIRDNQQHDQQQQQRELRLRQLEQDPTTRRLVLAVFFCYAIYIVGDVCFFVPLSPRHTRFTTYLIYLLAVMSNMAFIYQGFLLTILTMRVIVLRLEAMEADITQALQAQTTRSREWRTTRSAATESAYRRQEQKQQVQRWITDYQELRNDVQSLSYHFGVRMVVGLSMFVIEVTNLILNVWEAIGSELTRTQTLLLLLTYTANATILILVTFQTAYTSTLCVERIGPALGLLSLRTVTTTPDGKKEEDGDSYGGNTKAELHVLAQMYQQAPIRLRAGNFHVTNDYANALTAWFCGLFLVVFGMKLPKI